MAFPGWWEQVQQAEWLILPVVQASTDPVVREKLEPVLEEGIRMGKGNLVAAIRHILSGERDEAALSEPLDWEGAAVIRAILEGIAGKG